MIRVPEYLKPDWWITYFGLPKHKVTSHLISPGNPKRVDLIQSKLKNSKVVFERELIRVATGQYDNLDITVGSIGYTSPYAAIALEIFISCGVKTLIRVGSAGGLKEDIEIGEIVIPNWAARGEGTTYYYLPPGIPAQPSQCIFNSLVEAAEELGANYKIGPVWTTDAIFRETEMLVTQYKKQGIICVDMLTSTFFVIPQLKGALSGAILAISDNVITGQAGFGSHEFKKAEELAVEIALKAISKIR